MKRVLVCGGRDFCNWLLLSRVLAAAEPTTIISGMAPGADKMAMNWAHLNSVQFDGYPAKWATIRGIDRSAGPKRN